MTVKELINLLKKEDRNKLVAVSADEEGNGFGLLAEGFGDYEFMHHGKTIKTITLFPEHEYLDDVDDTQDDPEKYIFE